MNASTVKAMNALANSKSFLLSTVGENGETTINVEVSNVSVMESQALIACTYIALNQVCSDLGEYMADNPPPLQN